VSIVIPHPSLQKMQCGFTADVYIYLELPTGLENFQAEEKLKYLLTI
jgi:hypothetical protein